MSVTLAVALYFVIWWTILFAVLPFGIRTQGEAGEVVPGTPASAPVKPMMLRIVLTTSVAAAAILAVIYLVMRFQLIDLDFFTITTRPGRA